MAFRTGFRSFARWRTRCPPLPAPTLMRPRTATRLALGVSAALYMVSLNTLHGDSASETDDSDARNSADSDPPPLAAGFTADLSQWQNSVRYLGDTSPDGIIRMYWYSYYDSTIRIMARGPRTLISLLDGDFVTRVNIADVIQENLWFNLESLFRWYQVDHSAPQPVDLALEPHPSPPAIHSVIKTAITYTDEYILDFLLKRTFSSLSKKYAGDGIRATSSSELVAAMYEEDVRLLHIANLGNMRAILGRPQERPAEDNDNEGTRTMYDVHVLSVDHTPENAAERARMESAHPGEDVLADGTLFGRPYTRALGDSKLKWSPEVQARLHADYLGAVPDPRVKTPPYVSAEPEVSTIKVLPGDFLVLSSPWLTECLTDEEVVGLVGVWLEKHRDTALVQDNIVNTPQDQIPPPGVAVTLPEDLPVELKEDKTTMYRRWNVAKRFINEDVNVSTHLANNAMGGADTDLRRALMDINPGKSEGNIKSLAIAVVFFK